MKPIKTMLIPLFGILVGCSSRPPQPVEYTGSMLPLMHQVASAPQVIDIEDAIMVDYDSLIADIQYVPLGDEEGVIGEIKSILYHEGIYYIYDFKQDAVFLFNESGQCIKKIEDQGEGPEEYFAIYNIDIDPVSSELIIVDRLAPQTLYYDLNGNFKYKRKVNAQTGPAYWLKDSTMIYQMGTYQNNGSEELKHYNLLIMKGDSIVRKAMRYLPSQIGYCGTNGFLRGHDNTLYYRPLFSDSIYRINSDSTFSLAYYAKMENSVWEKHYLSEEFVNMYNENGCCLEPWLYDTKQFFIGYTNAYKTEENGNRMTCLFYDKKQRKTYVSRMKMYDKLTLLNRIWGFDAAGTKGNSLIVTINGGLVEEMIKERVKSGELKVTDPQLEKIVKNIDSDSNPLLVLTKFKSPHETE